MTQETKLNIGDLLENNAEYVSLTKPHFYIVYSIRDLVDPFLSYGITSTFQKQKVINLLNLSTGTTIERSERFLIDRINIGTWNVYK